MPFSKFFVTKCWRIRPLMVSLLVLELPLIVGMLTLVGIADPDTYRTRLWQNGADKGFNSAPSSILYDYANYRPVHVPLLWSQRLTTFNVVVSVMTLFILIVKTIMFVLHAFIPLLSVFVHALLLALFAVSVRNQSASDMSDPEHPSPGLPWYLSKGCSHATDGNYGYCIQARASYGLSIVMLALFFTYLVYSIYCCIPSNAEKEARNAKRRTDIELKQAWSAVDPDAHLDEDEKWERNRQMFLNLPKTPTTPYGLQAMTPRTTAFTMLSGGPPMPTSPGPAPTANAASTPRRALPFRKQWEELKADIK